MKKSEFDKIFRGMIKEVKSTRDCGQKEYAHTEDNVFANFERVAEGLNISREQALMVYVLKHVDAICNDAKTGVQVSDETVMSRAIDVCNYMILYTSLKKEPQPNENNTKPDGTVDGMHERSGSPTSEPQKWDEYSSQEA